MCATIGVFPLPPTLQVADADDRSLQPSPACGIAAYQRRRQPAADAVDGAQGAIQ